MNWFQNKHHLCLSIVLCNNLQPHPDGSGSDKLAKSALGAERLVPSRHFATTREALDYLRMELKDFEIIGMETTDQSQVYTDVEYSRKVALVLGNEVTGVDTELMVSAMYDYLFEEEPIHPFDSH